MPSSKVPPTRMELLQLRKKRKRAEKGHSLLEKKRDALIHEFFERIKTYKALKAEAFENLKRGYEQLHLAQAISGVDVVRSMGQGARPDYEVRVEKANLMGVSVPRYTIIDEERDQPRSSFGSSVYVQKTSESFETISRQLIKLSEIESTIHTLAEEIKKTKRRVNSLEHVKIPRMKESEERIERHLDEMERESFVRLKKIKEQLA